ncbi:PAS domain S-box-containing protein/diguanylate cyclase (GGDEF) domain-containing protein [Allopseudospirillum japonicum]|uniref:PAS domain S-box-containing protein/diguanylate cyclase (GGDEF) domain-containing protein n=1 Tax=Allopseudospirillum japonicum TaxID=64971 RepID=A0A1H6UYT0_9GAMM|nr:diguanylate cyclase [Allopseudospirillum japonicum]SEI93205.1 PAS domain S-box-containing protein/diguanylate cyclase (GGDEF) domain-containing protein [Allopseudospirillum japonicum]
MLECASASRGRLVLNMAATLFIFSLLIYASYHYSRLLADNEGRDKIYRFELLAQQATLLLQEKVDRLPTLLKATRGLVLSHPQLNQTHWDAFFASMQLDLKALGIVGITFTEYVPDGHKNFYLQQRREDFGRFTIFPQGWRSDYLVIRFVLPQAISTQIRGYDIGTEYRRRAAAEQARKQDQAAITLPLVLLPSVSHSLDYLMLLPIRTETTFIGWSTLGFSLSKLINELNHQLSDHQKLRIQVIDPRHRHTGRFAYDTGSQDLTPWQLKLQSLKQLQLGDQKLQLRLAPAQGSELYVSVADLNTSALIAGLFISCLGAGISLLVLNSRQAAAQMASRWLSQYQESEQRYQHLFDLSPEAIVICRQQKVLLLNRAARELFGCNASQALEGRSLRAYLDPQVQAAVQAHLDPRTGQEPPPLPLEAELRRLDGDIRFVELVCAPILFGEHAAEQFLFRDLSAQALSRAEAQLSRTLFEYASEPMMLTDNQGYIQMVNPAFTQMTGYLASEAQGQSVALLSSQMHDKSFFKQLWQTLHTQGEWTGEITNRRRDGSLYIQKTRINAIYDHHQHIYQYACVMTDITEQKREMDAIRHRALHDALTGLANRHHFEQEGAQALQTALQDSLYICVLFIDLDGFKPINDTYGHLIGDELLKVVAQRLQASVKEQDLVARIGGDEFLVLLTQLHDKPSALKIAQRIQEILLRPVTLDTQIQVHVGASIGMAYAPEHAQEIGLLVECADQAMYQGKHTGKGQIRIAQREPLTPL